LDKYKSLINSVLYICVLVFLLKYLNNLNTTQPNSAMIQSLQVDQL